jgi:hypothetical protein
MNFVRYFIITLYIYYLWTDFYEIWNISILVNEELITGNKMINLNLNSGSLYVHKCKYVCMYYVAKR